MGEWEAIGRCHLYLVGHLVPAAHTLHTPCLNMNIREDRRGGLQSLQAQEPSRFGWSNNDWTCSPILVANESQSAGPGLRIREKCPEAARQRIFLPPWLESGRRARSRHSSSWRSSNPSGCTEQPSRQRPSPSLHSWWPAMGRALHPCGRGCSWDLKSWPGSQWRRRCNCSDQILLRLLQRSAYWTGWLINWEGTCSSCNCTFKFIRIDLPWHVRDILLKFANFYKLWKVQQGLIFATWGSMWKFGIDLLDLKQIGCKQN